MEQALIGLQRVFHGNALSGRVSEIWQGWWCMLRCIEQRRRQRVALARLDDHLLRDIGVTPEQASAESAKPCWRA
jgi:uncharacterized protein YjiS (DUF1127 family)